MPQILEHNRFWLLASLLIGITYTFHHSTDVGPGWIMAWKAMACLFLAIYALHNHATGYFRLFAAVMVLSAMGDALLMINLVWGGAVFALAHCAAIALYAQNRRSVLTMSQRLLGLLLPIANPLLAWSITHSAMHVVYTMLSGIMAGLAWTSRFPRYRTGIGVLLFLLSDLMIFTGIGSTPESVLPRMTIWVVYYSGQLLIALGVVRGLRGGQGNVITSV